MYIPLKKHLLNNIQPLSFSPYISGCFILTRECNCFLYLNTHWYVLNGSAIHVFLSLKEKGKKERKHIWPNGNTSTVSYFRNFYSDSYIINPITCIFIRAWIHLITYLVSSDWQFVIVSFHLNLYVEENRKFCGEFVFPQVENNTRIFFIIT